jgi:hypothetical protein
MYVGFIMVKINKREATEMVYISGREIGVYRAVTVFE